MYKLAKGFNGGGHLNKGGILMRLGYMLMCIFLFYAYTCTWVCVYES